MSQKMAQIIFVIINIFSIFAVAYAIYDFVIITSAIEIKEKQIIFDSGTYYLLVISVSWILSAIQYVGLKNKYSIILKYGSQIAVFWFLFMLLLANLIPYYLSSKFEEAGYVKCDDLAEISRIAKGESSIYQLSDCNL